MTFEEELKAWNIVLSSNRQVGSTTAAVTGVKQHDGVLVCAHLKHADMLKGRCKTFAGNPTKLLGVRKPLVFDHYTVHTIILRSLSERIDKQRHEELVKQAVAKERQRVREAIQTADENTIGDDVHQFRTNLEEELDL